MKQVGSRGTIKMFSLTGKAFSIKGSGKARRIPQEAMPSQEKPGVHAFEDEEFSQ